MSVPPKWVVGRDLEQKEFEASARRPDLVGVRGIPQRLPRGRRLGKASVLVTEVMYQLTAPVP
jgi:hypothetical protein